MKRWCDFASEKPEMAEAGRVLIYQFRVGLGYLATIRRDGGPRLHPVCPVLANGGLYAFIGNHSPKVHDLLRDGRFALHPSQSQVDDEFTVSGRAVPVTDAAIRQVVYDAYVATGAFTSDDTLFELLLGARCTPSTDSARAGRRSTRVARASAPTAHPRIVSTTRNRASRSSCAVSVAGLRQRRPRSSIAPREHAEHQRILRVDRRAVPALPGGVHDHRHHGHGSGACGAPSTMSVPPPARHHRL
jgi:hypothetical protein